jgi:glycosyltransferase involved in cell wall biosynthesis
VLFSELLKTVWQQRRDLHALLPDIHAPDRVLCARWFCRAAVAELGIDPVFVDPVRRSLAKRSEPDDLRFPVASPRQSRFAPSHPLSRLMAFEGEAFVRNAYRAILQRLPDGDGRRAYLAQLEAGTPKIEILSAVRNSAEGRRIGVYIPGLTLASVFSRLRRHLPRPMLAVLDCIEHPPESLHPSLAARSAKQQRSFARFSGFWTEERFPGSGPAAWMGRHASVRLGRLSKGACLELAGEYDAESQLKANGTPLTALSLAVNGERLAVIRLAASGAFKHACVVSVPAEAATLSLAASQGFVPARIGTGGDRRELSLKISRLSIDGRPLLDFSLGSGAVYQAPSQPQAAGVSLVGYPYADHSIGQSLRISAACCQAGRIPHATLEVPGAAVDQRPQPRPANRCPASPIHGVNLIHVNADELPRIRQENALLFDGRYNIGYWAWELSEFPDRFLPAFDLLDEVWVPSRFVLDAVSAKSPIPVLRMPHAIEAPRPASASRERFGLPARGFLFLTIYDLRSFQPRKNPEGTLKAFVSAFDGQNACHLVIKVQQPQAHPEDFARLMAWIGARPNVHLIAETLPRRDISALESLCDCYVSLHRSEGFGLPLAECMALGKPVIATGWSGNTDFMNGDNSFPVNYTLVPLLESVGPYDRGQIWAEPDVAHAAWLMKQVVENAGLREAVAARGRATIDQEFSPRAVGRRYRQRLALLAQQGLDG